MADILQSIEAVAGLAEPWYVKHWKSITVAVAAAAVAGYIGLLHHRLAGQTELLKLASDELIKATAQYQDDVAHLKTAIAKQNEAIVAYEAQSARAKTTVAVASAKSSTIHQKVERQVNDILTQPKPTDAESAISSLVTGVNNLQWDQVK